jgi:hypothetical protein
LLILVVGEQTRVQMEIGSQNGPRSG